MTHQSDTINRESAALRIAQATSLGTDFEETLQDAISAALPETPDEEQADLYARIVTSQGHAKFKTAAGFMALVMYELRYTKQFRGESE